MADTTLSTSVFGCITKLLCVISITSTLICRHGRKCCTGCFGVFISFSLTYLTLPRVNADFLHSMLGFVFLLFTGIGKKGGQMDGELALGQIGVGNHVVIARYFLFVLSSWYCWGLKERA